MRFKLRLILEKDDPKEDNVILDIATFNRDLAQSEHIGLSIAESNKILASLQKNIVVEQISQYLKTHSH